jgi:hypothetical protein
MLILPYCKESEKAGMLAKAPGSLSGYHLVGITTILPQR